MGCQSSNQIHTELSLRVEDCDVETEEVLLLRSNLLLRPLGEAEDVGETEALLGDGHTVLIEPFEFSLGQHTPFTLNGN